MSKILLIESATAVCSVSIVSTDKKIIAIREELSGNSHSELLTFFIEELIAEELKSISELVAVCVSKGPGSYTGLRIGLAAAKGLCYALGIPMLTVNTIESMAYGQKNKYSKEILLCPMIDARRMEVYTCLYDSNINRMTEIEAKVIDEQSYKKELENKKIVFFGDGADKCRGVIKSSKALFDTNFHLSSIFMTDKAIEKYQNKEFADLAYSEPFYLKEYQALKSKVKGLGR